MRVKKLFIGWCHDFREFLVFSEKSAGDYHVIGAVRDLEKMNIVAELEGFDMDRFTPMSHDDNDLLVVMLENLK